MTSAPMALGRLRFAMALAVSACLQGCEPTAREPAATEETWRGPIVVVSLSSIRADSVGALGGSGDTPHLDELIAASDWAGPATASSAFGPASIASAFTGLPPWQHGVTDPGGPAVRRAVRMLAERLADAGATNKAFVADPWMGPAFGFNQGFSRFALPGRTHSLMSHLRSLDAGLSLTWVHLASPGLPYLRRPPNADGRMGQSALAAQSLDVDDLARFLSTDRDLPVDMTKALPEFHLNSIRALDGQLGRVLTALRQSNRLDSCLVVVLGDAGASLGDDGRVMRGYELDRGALQVPLIVKLPAQLRGTGIELAADPGASTSRVAATVLEIVGLEREGGLAPSLREAGRGVATASLLFDNGVHRLALLGADRRLDFECRFSAPQQGWVDARIDSILGEDDSRWDHLRELDARSWARRGNCQSEESRGPGAESLGSEPDGEELLFWIDQLSDPLLRETTRPRSLTEDEAEQLRGRGFPVRSSWFSN